jgi:hypothetical protein
MMPKSKLQYQLADGSKVPLFEAEYDMSFAVRRSDRLGAIIGDPRLCIEAKGICKMPRVVEAYIGSGKDAYVVFEPTSDRPYRHALHFIIPASSRAVRDAFDTNRKLKSQILMLKVPAKGTTVEYRRNLNQRRRDEIKNGAPVKKRGTIGKNRMERLGVPPRPRAKIDRNVVSL